MELITQTPAATRPVRLSNRELEILRLVAAGHSSRDVAEVLCVSKRTIDFHMNNIYQKLRVHNRMHAVRMALRLGLLPFEVY
ncbi:MAG: LuxR C-terminal-related transcriptional regulator [Fimbriimonadaceae bacterium]